MATHQVTRLTTLLTLTAAQQAQATTIFTAEATANSTTMASMRTARTALKTAVEANDQAGIATQASQIGSLTTQQVSDQAKAQAAFYAILTADQKTKYDSLGGPGGFGGPGGPGGGPAGFRGAARRGPPAQ